MPKIWLLSVLFCLVACQCTGNEWIVALSQDFAPNLPFLFSGSTLQNNVSGD
jgi:hypothetical protein